MGNKSRLKLKAKDNFCIREIAGDYILIPIGSAAMHIHGMISLSESGYLLWNEIQNICSEEALVQVMLREYEVTPEIAEQDVKSFIEKMREVGIVDVWEEE